jgi:glycosyltransferase involved in cell wall biosynthesis
LISVLIPVRNGGDELTRCLDAIAAQQVDDEFEVLMVDSGSTDGTPEPARAHGAGARTRYPEWFDQRC